MEINMKRNVICQGFHCPVRKQCANYYEGNGTGTAVGKDGRHLAHCTNQKDFVKKEES